MALSDGSLITTGLQMPTFILGIIVLLYVASFVLFAIVRILTGFSIQRLGYLCLKRISYEPRDGVRIEIRKLGFLLHRPTFAQPTWISLVIQDSQVTFGGDAKDAETGDIGEGTTPITSRRGSDASFFSPPATPRAKGKGAGAGAGLKQRQILQKLKPLLDKVHRLLKYMRFADLVVTNAAFTLAEVGTLQVGSFTMMVDMRTKSAERRRPLNQKKTLAPGESLIEWMLSTRSVLFTAEGKETVEVINHCLFNLYGILDVSGKVVKDSNVSIKLGRINLPWDDIAHCIKRLSSLRKIANIKLRKKESAFLSERLAERIEEETGSKSERIADALMKSKEFIQTLITNVKELQLSVNHIVVSKSLKTTVTDEPPNVITLEMKEIGMDIHRLDQKSPAHRMYFSPQDVAHQALLAAISISLTLDDGQGKQDKLMYIPMVTMTSKTTLPSKSLQLVEKPENDLNANILLANMVVTSPSIDLEPHHLPLALALFGTGSTGRPGRTSEKAQLLTRLLPKASIKFSIQEPVLRVLFPRKDGAAGDADMLISTHSSLSADIESSYSNDGNFHYSLNSSFRVAAHQLYYRSLDGERHNLLQTETFELRAQMTASPDVQVTMQAYLDTCVVRLVRAEIVQGLQQMMQHIRKERRSQPRKKLFLGARQKLARRIPSWITHITFEGKDFSFEVAGIDAEISNQVRGLAVQFELMIGEYKSQSDELVKKPGHRRRAGSKSFNPEVFSNMRSPSAQQTTDGRRLSMELRGFECYTMDGQDSWAPDPFFSLPIVETEISTSTDADGPITRLATRIASVAFQYSLYNHYSFYVAANVLNAAFGLAILKNIQKKERPPLSEDWNYPHDHGKLVRPEGEFTSVDIRIRTVRVKAHMPAEPHLMMDLESLEAGIHRWGFPYIKARTTRLYSQSPRMSTAWVRVLSIRHGYIDFKKRQVQAEAAPEKCFDISAEALRFAIPYQLTLYKVTDNIVNTTKAVEQIHHRYATGTNEYILEKRPEPPKRVPKVTLRAKALLFEIEDDPFESKLTLIYRVGLAEQKMRLQRMAAFDAKVKMLREKRKLAEQGPSRTPTVLENPPKSRLRTRTRTIKLERSQTSGTDSTIRGRPRGKSTPENGGEQAAPEARRYEEPTVAEEEALEKLQMVNSTSWIRRIRWAHNEMEERVQQHRKAFWGSDDFEVRDQEEVIIGLPKRPSLASAYIYDLEIGIDRPSFGLSQLPDFLYTMGKGLPKDTQFSFLVPMSIRLDFKEAKIQLRDYPLPFIHVPRMAPGQSSRLPSWSLSSDFVLAEEFRAKGSMRMVCVNIVHPQMIDGVEKGGFAVDVRRTVSPVKSYSDFHVKVNTIAPTRITWATSYQPAIQDMMMVFETFTKPHVDPSERIGFWDKIRFVFHSGMTVEWRNEGEVQLNLKGSRDPYKVTGKGAGFIMCWKNNVRWEIARSDDPKKFMKVSSDEYVLAVPEFTKKAREFGEEPNNSSALTPETIAEIAHFKKVIMKLSGGVMWLVGLAFEQDIGGPANWKEKERSFEFVPHYEVSLKEPKYAFAPPGEVYDAFRGFRSHHIHLSLSIECPTNRNWKLPSQGTSFSYNTIHLSPRFFTHFFAWWGLFAGNMSLPIRQGALWPGPEKSTKKFARHLATIEYQLLLSPLFISHIYKHNEREDGSFVGATGLKARLDTFMLDIHQRREEVTTTIKGLNRERLTFGMKINEALVDFQSADIRAVSATIIGASADDMAKTAAEERAQSYTDGRKMEPDMSQFTIHDDDYSWVDLDDFIEIDWGLPTKTTPKTVISPLAFAPRTTYFRQTDHSPPNAPPASRPSPFGHDPSHDCIMGENNDPREIQCGLVQARLEKVNYQMKRNKEELDSLAERTAASKDKDPSQFIAESTLLMEQSSLLYNKMKILESMLRRMSERLDEPFSPESYNARPDSAESEPELYGLKEETFADYISDFDNRFIIHNLQAKWNNSLRNIIVRYINQVNQRRGIIYYMSRRAVRFILDIVEEQKAAAQRDSFRNSASGTDVPPTPTENFLNVPSVEKTLKQLLEDPVKYVTSLEQDSEQIDGSCASFTRDSLTKEISEDYLPQNSYHIRFIAPQIQMQSDKDNNAAVLVTAQGMQLKVVSIMDKKRLSDEVSGLVQRRYLVNMDNTQFFVTHEKNFSAYSMWLHSANRYGCAENTSWPPWVPLENMFDFHNTPLGFAKVVERTSAIMRYDKHNSLRLKYNDQINNAATAEEQAENHESKETATDVERRIDNVWVDFPKVKIACDSAEYYAMFIIVQDVLLYSEPRERLRSEKLEKIMLASDFSDLRGAPELVERLQTRIGQLVEVKQHLQINSNRLDQKGWENMIHLDQNLNNCEDELFFLMKAITTAQRKIEDSQTSGMLRWFLSSDEVAWQLNQSDADPLANFRLQNASYQRVDNSDGSNFNTLVVQMMRGFNMLPNAAYPEMIAPYFDHIPTAKEWDEAEMLKVEWHMLEAIAGIPVINSFEVKLFPMKIQLEREIGDRLFEYIFPNSGTENAASPFHTHGMHAIKDFDGEGQIEKYEESAASITSDPSIKSFQTATKQTPGDSKLRFRSDTALGSMKDQKALVSPSPSIRASVEAMSMKSRRSNDSAAPNPQTLLPGPAKETKKRPLFHRSNNDKNAVNAQSDELTQMIKRASNYMTLVYVKVPSVVLFLSYKGRAERNFEDIHEFVFKLPQLEYRNKMWSNLDLALRLKKDIIKALISHTGAILENKITHTRPGTKSTNFFRKLGTSMKSSSDASSDPNALSLTKTRRNSATTTTATFLSSDLDGASSSSFRTHRQRPSSSFSNTSANSFQDASSGGFPGPGIGGGMRNSPGSRSSESSAASYSNLSGEGDEEREERKRLSAGSLGERPKTAVEGERKRGRGLFARALGGRKEVAEI